MEHFYTDDNGVLLYNTKYNVIFPHDEYNEDLILNSIECLYFIYTSQYSLYKGNYTIDGKNVIKDVYII